MCAGVPEQKIGQCAKEVKKIQTSILVGIADVEFTINDSNEKLSAHRQGPAPTLIVRGHQGI
jgi:hypothetical protein